MKVHEVPDFLTKSEFKALVKTTDTPQAWEIYNALWDTAETHIRAVDEGTPPWAASLRSGMDALFKEIDRKFRSFEEKLGSFDGKFGRIEEICTGFRTEIDELKSVLGMFLSEEEEDETGQELENVVDN